jgi:SAM-dependent methyltransferase
MKPAPPAGRLAGPAPTALHERRLAAVLAAVRACGARRVLDLGCGDGDLFCRLAAEPGLERLAGLDRDRAALTRLAARLAALRAAGGLGPAEITLVEGSILDAGGELAGFDAALLVETIEHIDPGRLSALETAVFRRMRPARVVLTTPNAEYNPLLGVPARRRRHPDHRFEWDRARLDAWAAGVAARAGYRIATSDLGGSHPTLGGPSRIAIFDRDIA